MITMQKKKRQQVFGKNNQQSKKGTYNKHINGRGRVNEQFGGGKYDPKKDYKK